MNQVKIGKFIAEMRKEQNLTQLDLAEKLGISNKTVSKWECGNGMPDYAVMESLCEILKINVNDLLSGERLSLQEYNKKAEENMMSLIQESGQNHGQDIRAWLGFIIGIAVLAVVVFLVIDMWGGYESVSYFMDVPIFLYDVVLSLVVVIMAGELKDFMKAFPLVMKKVSSTEMYQVKKSVLAVKTTMISINVAGAMTFVIGVVTACKGSQYISFFAVAMLSVRYSLAVTLLLIPIYIRLKKKLVEE